MLKISEFLKKYTDKALIVVLTLTLFAHYLKFTTGIVDEGLLLIVAGAATLPVLGSAWESLRNRKINVDLLAGVALLVSLLTGEWASAVFINLMLTSARIFDDYTQDRARNAIESLLKLKPARVKVKRGDVVSEVAVDDVRAGDLVIVELGARVPVDGEVVTGAAQLDQSSLTGESLPVSKAVGDQVLTSTLCVSGSLVVRADRVGADTTFEKIIKLVEQSQRDKAGIQTLAEKFAGWYIGLSLAAVVLILVVFHNLHLVLSLLLVTCADDIAVALPLGFSAAIALAARYGIIIKGGAYLEGLMKVKTVLLDKTGTLTRGKLHVSAVYSFDGYTNEEVAALAATSSFYSNHPISQAVVQYARDNQLAFDKVEDFVETSGEGTTAVLNGKKIVCGKLTFLEKEGVTAAAETQGRLEAIRSEGTSSLLPVAYDGALIGVLALEDEVRAEAKTAVARLRAQGVRNVVMLTGDNEQVAAKVAAELGLTAYHANLMPEDKLRIVRSYINDQDKVAMVGDGVNDAAALALSDVGIAMGVVGTNAAIEAADVALMEDSFAGVPRAMAIGKLAGQIAVQDFAIWGVTTVLGLYLVFSGTVGPTGAAAYNFGTDFLPLLNVGRLLSFGFKRVIKATE
jgi:heavy metal translocating P-type ATPase